MAKDILVVIECADGAPAGVSLENIAAAKAVANGAAVVAVTTCEACAQTAIEFGADSAIVVEGPQFEVYNADAIADAVAQIAAEAAPAAILAGATPKGKDIVPRIAAKLATGSVNDATSIELDGDAIKFGVPVYGGGIISDVEIVAAPAVASIRGGSVSKLEPVAGKAGEIVKKAITAADGAIKFEVKEAVNELSEAVNLEDANVIVTGGRGMGSAENYMKLQELCDITGGVLGCSRPVYEEGWISRAHQVGQSGKIVAPQVYYAFGISGAIQHVAGMIGSKFIVAVNKDEEAPIFDVADIGIVGNANEVLPLIIEEIKKAK